jgi:hypothetical protein
MTAAAERFARLRGRMMALPLVLAAVLLHAGAALPQRTQVDAGRSASTQARPFDHRRHESVACSACHGTGERHRTLLIRTDRDCLACHHDTARRSACTACHDRAQLPEPGKVQVALALSVWDTTRSRELRFGHRIHADVDCRECHRAPVTLVTDRTCSSCHEEHHTPAADCRSCHETTPVAAHQAAAHLTCSGAGCHAARTAPTPVLSRALCLSCHETQRTHEPDGVCASCHQIPHTALPPSLRIPGEVRR